MPVNENITPPSFVITNAEGFREVMKHLEKDFRSYIDGITSGCEPLFDRGECIAQAMLALRHLEDARMRCGKIIQYADVKANGESCYAK